MQDFSHQQYLSVSMLALFFPQKHLQDVQVSGGKAKDHVAQLMLRTKNLEHLPSSKNFLATQKPTTFTPKNPQLSPQKPPTFTPKNPQLSPPNQCHWCKESFKLVQLEAEMCCFPFTKFPGVWRVNKVWVHLPTTESPAPKFLHRFSEKFWWTRWYSYLVTVGLHISIIYIIIHTWTLRFKCQVSAPRSVFFGGFFGAQISDPWRIQVYI